MDGGAPSAPLDRVLLVRPRDQLRVEVVLEGIVLVGDELVADGADPGVLTLVVPPQHTVEEIPDADVATAPAANRVSGPSQLRTVVKPGTRIPFTVDGLLDWADRALVLDPRATASGGTLPTTAPADTFIELPQGLYLSPGADGRFVADAPRTFDRVTQAWRMRLGVRGVVDGVPTVVEPESGVDVRAVWTDGHQSTVPADDWIVAVDEFARLPTHVDQRWLVRAMGDHDMDDEYPDHEPATVHRLWLSTLGGWLTAAGSFAGTGLVASWEQRIVTGRDALVRVAHRGFLAPFGHVASVVTVAERTFLVDRGGNVTAALQQREFLSVTPNHVAMGDLAGAMPWQGRELPFTRVDVVSNMTVEITHEPIPGVVDTDVAFVPLDLDGDPVVLDFTAVDRTATTVDFRMPATFVRIDAGDADVAAVVAWYGDDVSRDRRASDLHGQALTFADEPDGTQGEGRTTLPTFDLQFTLNLAAGGDLPAGFPALVPALETASVVDARLDALRGVDASPFPVTLGTDWLANGLDVAGNVALGFLDLVEGITLPFSGDGAGLAAPDLQVTQLTALLGPAIRLGGPGSRWDPVAALGEGAMFLGSVLLTKLLAVVDVPADVGDAPGLPRLDVELHRPEPGALPDELCLSLTWSPPLRSWGDTLLVAQDIEDSPFPAGAAGELDFLLRHCLPLGDLLDGVGEPAVTVDVSVRNVMVQLPPPNPIIGVAFSTVRFLDPPDGPPDVDVDIAAIRLMGALAFLDPLQELLDSLGGGPRLAIRDDEIEADLTIPLPDISVGVLGLSGLEVGTGLVVDLTGGPLRSAFNLGTREDPFTLSILGFGGSGSLELEASPHPVGIARLELSLAFVIELTIDVVVAKGSLSASFGASLELTATTSRGDPSVEVVLTAFLDVVGEVQVLGLVSLMVQVELSLEYAATTRLLTGEAAVQASVDIGFIEKEVSFSVRHQMELGDQSAARAALAAPRGRSASPARDGFVARFPKPEPWADYCAAFAA